MFIYEASRAELSLSIYYEFIHNANSLLIWLMQMVLVNNYVNINYWSYYLLVDYLFSFALFWNVSKSERFMWTWDSIFIRTRLIFHCIEFAGFISAGRFVKHSCQRIVEHPGNSGTKNVKDAGHKKKNIFCRQWLLDGKAIGIISFRLQL